MFHIRVLQLEEGGDYLSAFGADVVAVLFGNFTNQAMSAEQSQAVRDSIRASPSFVTVRCVTVQPRRNIAVRKTRRQKIAAAHRFEQLHFLLREKFDAPITLAFFDE